MINQGMFGAYGCFLFFCADSSSCIEHKLRISDSNGGVKTVCGQGKPSNVTLSGDKVRFQFTAPGSSNSWKGFMTHYSIIGQTGNQGGQTGNQGIYHRNCLSPKESRSPLNLALYFFNTFFVQKLSQRPW